MSHTMTDDAIQPAPANMARETRETSDNVIRIESLLAILQQQYSRDREDAGSGALK